MTKRESKHGATRRKHTAVGKTRRKKKAVRWTANTGTVFHAANTEPTDRNWYSWTSAATALKQNHFRRSVPKGTSTAVMAPWINNSATSVRGSMARNYPGKRPWTRSLTRLPRSAALAARRRAEMLAGHLSAIEEGRENGLGVIIPLNDPAEEAEFLRLASQLAQGATSEEIKARFRELLAKRSTRH
jgi:hypothetical protein